HTLVELQKEGHETIVVDNLSNSNEKSLQRVEEITGRTIKFYNNDLRDGPAVHKIFSDNSIDAVIHFAALKAVGESTKRPLDYYDNNLASTVTLLEAMSEYRINRMVFSSSATVYGDPGTVAYTESLPTGQNITNPYGQTKY